MLFPRYILGIALLIAVVAASFAAGMVVMEAASKTGNQPLYFAIGVLIATGALLLSALLSYRAVVDKVAVGIASRRTRSSRLKTSP